MAKHFYISFDSISYPEIFLSNNPVSTERQIQGMRVWREEVDEIKIARTGNETVYDTLETNALDDTEFDTEVELEVYDGIRGAGGVLYWQGLFSVSDTKFDLQHKTFNIDIIRINDDYRTILEKADKQYELDANITPLEQERLGYSEPLSIATTWVNGTIGTAFDTLVAVGGTISTASAGAGAGYEAYLPINESLATGDIVIIDVSAFTSNTTPTFNIMNGAGNLMTDEGAKNIVTGLMGWTIDSFHANPRIWLQSIAGDTTGTVFTTRKVDDLNDHINAGELLMTFIENFIDSPGTMFLTAYTGNVVSTFFDNDALPTGAPSSISTIMTGEPNGNYVTETTTNEVNDTIIGLLRKWFGITGDPSFKLSFNDIMGSLRDMFQVYWFIDADDKFRIEHERYFVAQVADSTAIDLTNYPTAEPGRRGYNYNKSALASTEQYSWNQAANQDFVGRDIIYNNFETFNNTILYSLNYFTTDLKYVIDNLADATDSALGLYNCQLLTGITGDDLYEVIIATGAITSTEISNAEFSWGNLHEDYWTWSRMSENATLNSTGVTMDSAVRFLEQPGIRFFYSTAIDPFTKITTELTSAAPIEIQRDLQTDIVEFILGFDPYKL